MFEYDKEMIIRSLKIYGFDMEEIDVDKINYVPMHDYRVATNNKPLLYINNLQCCVGVYAYNNNFGFCAHINTVAMENGDYEVDHNKKPTRCRRIDDLYETILKEKEKFINPVKLGISLGSNPLDKEVPTMRMIYKEIATLICKLNKVGIDYILLPEQQESNFIIDTENSKIIYPNHKKIRNK